MFWTNKWLSINQNGKDLWDLLLLLLLLLLLRGPVTVYYGVFCAACAYVDACQAEIVLNCSSFRSTVSTLQLLLANFLMRCVTAWIFLCMCDVLSVCVHVRVSSGCELWLKPPLIHHRLRVESQSGKLKAMSALSQSIHSSCHSLQSSFFIFSYLFLSRPSLRFITVLAIIVIDFFPFISILF